MKTTMAQDILAIILGLEPLATSICTLHCHLEFLQSVRNAI